MKKILKFFSYIFVLLSGIFFVSNNVQAVASRGDIITGRAVKGPYYVMHEKQNGHHMWLQASFLNRTSDGQFVYCVQPYFSVKEDNTYNVTTEDYAAVLNMSQGDWEQISRVAYYGYGFKDSNYDHTDDKWYIATQMIIWKIADPSIDSYFTNTLKGERNDNVLVNEMNEILSLANNHKLLPKFNNVPSEMNIGQTVTISDSNNVLRNYDITNVSNGAVTKNDNNLNITATNVGNISFNITRLGNRYGNVIELYYASDSQNVMHRGNLDPITIKMNVKVYGGKVQINKVDSDNNSAIAQGEGLLSNAKYGVYDNTGKLLQTLTTDKNGYAISDYLPSLGRYYIQELNSSKGYTIDSERHYFDITSDSLLATVTSKEKVIKNYISILKQYDYVDGNTTFLNAESGIQFEIYNSNNNLVKTITTDKNGYATTELAYGTYKFHQVNTNTGFEKIYDFNVVVSETSEKTQYYNILNNKMAAYLQVFKIDSETKEKITLSSAKFKIFNVDKNQYVSQYVGGKIYDEFETDEEGKFITYLKLEAGNYKLIEVSSPKGYLIRPEGYSFKIGEDSQYNYTTYGSFITVYVENTPIKGQIEINKNGEKFIADDYTFWYDEIPLKGIEFSIYNSNNELVDVVTTDKNGYAISKELSLGKYYVIETKTINGYILDSKKYEVELTEIDNKTRVVYTSLEILNKLKKGDLEFTKSDLTTGEGIPNTLVEIYNENDELIFGGLTDDQGKIIIKDLVVGKYYIKELEPATGYKLSEEIVYFEILENGEVVKANMTNEKITSTLEFTKVDFSTSEPLPDTLIEIYNDKDELVFSGKTNEEGKIVIEKLEYGKYYILEKEAPEGYELNNEKMYFEVTSDGEVIKCTMTDNKIPEEIDVPITEDNTYIIPISIVLFVSATGVIIYEEIKKRKNK